MNVSCRLKISTKTEWMKNETWTFFHSLMLLVSVHSFPLARYANVECLANASYFSLYVASPWTWFRLLLVVSFLSSDGWCMLWELFDGQSLMETFGLEFLLKIIKNYFTHLIFLIHKIKFLSHHFGIEISQGQTKFVNNLYKFYQL